MHLKPIGISIDITVANTVNNSKSIYIFNTSSGNKLVTIANSSANVSSFYISSNSGLGIIKSSSDTIQLDGGYATPIAYSY